MSQNQTTDKRKPDFTEPADYDIDAESEWDEIENPYWDESCEERRELFDAASEEPFPVTSESNPRLILIQLYSAINFGKLGPDPAREVIDHADGSQWGSVGVDPDEMGDR